MEQTFYLLTTLIYGTDDVSDRHTLYAKLEDALKAFEEEVADCQENFNPMKGSFTTDLPRCKEWLTEDGLGYCVTIVEMKPL